MPTGRLNRSRLHHERRREVHRPNRPRGVEPRQCALRQHQHERYVQSCVRQVARPPTATCLRRRRPLRVPDRHARRVVRRLRLRGVDGRSPFVVRGIEADENRPPVASRPIRGDESLRITEYCAMVDGPRRPRFQQLHEPKPPWALGQRIAAARPRGPIGSGDEACRPRAVRSTLDPRGGVALRLEHLQQGRQRPVPHIGPTEDPVHRWRCTRQDRCEGTAAPPGLREGAIKKTPPALTVARPDAPCPPHAAHRSRPEGHRVPLHGRHLPPGLEPPFLRRRVQARPQSADSMSSPAHAAMAPFGRTSAFNGVRVRTIGSNHAATTPTTNRPAPIPTRTPVGSPRPGTPRREAVPQQGTRECTPDHDRRDSEPASGVSHATQRTSQEQERSKCRPTGSPRNAVHEYTDEQRPVLPAPVPVRTQSASPSPTRAPASMPPASPSQRQAASSGIHGIRRLHSRPLCHRQPRCAPSGSRPVHVGEGPSPRARVPAPHAILPGPTDAFEPTGGEARTASGGPPSSSSPSPSPTAVPPSWCRWSSRCGSDRRHHRCLVLGPCLSTFALVLASTPRYCRHTCDGRSPFDGPGPPSPVHWRPADMDHDRLGPPRLCHLRGRPAALPGMTAFPQRNPGTRERASSGNSCHSWCSQAEAQSCVSPARSMADSGSWQ